MTYKRIQQDSHRPIPDPHRSPSVSFFYYKSQEAERKFNGSINKRFSSWNVNAMESWMHGACVCISFTSAARAMQQERMAKLFTLMFNKSVNHVIDQTKVILQSSHGGIYEFSDTPCDNNKKVTTCAFDRHECVRVEVFFLVSNVISIDYFMTIVIELSPLFAADISVRLLLACSSRVANPAI